MADYIKNFKELTHRNTQQVGGKNASLGEMISELEAEGIKVPGGFATTADTYWEFIHHNDLEEKIGEALDRLDRKSFENLKEVGSEIREAMEKAKMPEKVAKQIKEAYQDLKKNGEGIKEVAVRSSATAEDLPEASFAGQHESFMNVEGDDAVVEHVKKCMVSLFTDRAIKYREDNEFDHLKVALSAGVQQMIRSDKASAGVAFTLDPKSGFDRVLYISGSWGLGENVVQGNVNTDEFYVSKPALEKEKYPILSKNVGSKNKTMVYAQGGKDGETIENQETPEEKRKQWVLNDEEIIQLGAWCTTIEKHYGKPMDIEWAKDGRSGKLFIVQARPETVHSQQQEVKTLKNYHLKEKSDALVKGVGIGDKIASGKARILDSPEESDKLEQGDVLVTEITNPDWDPIMKKASAIVTNSGGRTSHAAIVARELGTVATIGARGATDTIEEGQAVTVSTAEGNEGVVYKGELEWEEQEIDLSKLGDPDTEVMFILADPGNAFHLASYPVDGVGLLRLELIINNSIKAHPLALLHYDDLEDEEVKQEIAELTHNYSDKAQFFVDELAMAVGMIAAAFEGKDVIVRMSDFKSNEYANLLGGKQFEPEEENPMLGFRGASRYYSQRYKKGFGLECKAMKKVRDEMGFTNVKLMIPFCRTPDEGKKVLETMKEFGLKQGENGLEVYTMVEIPSNVMQADIFAGLFDGFSIGSNDLTQLTLGVDRDSELVNELFDERNGAAQKMIAQAIDTAHRKKKKVGLCGQAPSDFPEMARFLVEKGIDSISFNPDALLKGLENVLEAEKGS